jgi:hypothetical protein
MVEVLARIVDEILLAEQRTPNQSIRILTTPAFSYTLEPLLPFK